MWSVVRAAAVVPVCLALVGCSAIGPAREAPAEESGSIVVGVSGAFAENHDAGRNLSVGEALAFALSEVTHKSGCGGSP